MKPSSSNRFFVATALAFASFTVGVSADTVTANATARTLLPNQGDQGALSLYSDGVSNIQRSWLNFDLSAYSGKAMVGDVTMTLQAGIFGNNLTGVQLGSANAAWTAAGITWGNQPAITIIPGVTNPNGIVGPTGPVTWTIPGYAIEKWATLGYNGIGMTSGAGSNQHFFSLADGNSANHPKLTLTSANGANGTWTGGSGNWTDPANWASSTVAQGIDRSATINGGTAVTVTMDTSRSIGSLALSGANHSIDSGAGTLGFVTSTGTPTISVATGTAVTIAANIGGLDGLTKLGNGSLTLSGINNCIGTTTVSAGSLSLAGSNSLPPSSPVNIAAGTIVSNDAPSETSFNLGALTLNGGTLAATATPAGNLGNFHLKGDVTVGGSSMSTISADVRVIQNDNRIFNVADVDVGSGVDLLVSGKLGHYNGSSWGFATKTGAGTMKLSGINELGSMTVSAGRLILEDNAIGWTFPAGGLTNNSQLEFSVTSGSRSYTAGISGTGALFKTGAGNMTLSAANSFTGDTKVSGGKIILGNASALQNSVYDTTDSTGATGLDVNGEAALTLGGVKGSVNLATAITGYSGVTNLNLNLQNGVSATYLGNITDGATAMNLNKSGTGTQTLTGNNSYTGDTLIQGGTLAFTAGTSTIGNLTNNAASLIFSGNSVVTGGTLHFQSFNPQLTISENADVTLTGGITHLASIGGDPYHAANYHFLGGILRTPSISGPSIVWNQTGASMHFDGTRIVATEDNGNFITTLGWDHTNTINLRSTDGAIIDTAGFDIGVQVVMQNESGHNGKLTKLGAGTLTLSALNTYTGDTTVENGTLSVAQSNFADSSTVTIGTSGASPAVLHLPNVGTDIVTSLIIDGVAQAGNGAVYDSTNSGGAITGDGQIQVGTAPVSGYASWALGKPGFTETDTILDPDNDGIKNLLEYVLNGNPMASDMSILPSLDTAGTNFVFSFTRRLDSAGDTTQAFETSTNLSDWTTRPPLGIPASIVEMNNGTIAVGPATGTPPNEVQAITITVPKAGNTKLFGRLQVVK